MSKKWLALLLAMMMVMSLTGAQAIGTPTDICKHPSLKWVSTSSETHAQECEVCGWQTVNGLHYHVCTQDATDMTCALCGGEFTGDRTKHILEEGQAYEYDYDDEAHWNVCPICHKATGDDGDWHSNENGDPAGICSVCGAPYGGYTTPAPTATPQPTKKPSSSKTSSVAAATATPEPEQESGLESLIELATEDDEFTLYTADSREDGVIANLTSHLDEEALGGFAAWRESMDSVEALEATESYGSFVEMAKALVQALFPEKAEGEVDECLVALLQSGFDGTLEAAELATLGEDVDGEIVGYLAAEGYELYLVLTDSGVELLVREA